MGAPTTPGPDFGFKCNEKGPVARSLVSANRWLSGIKLYRFPWYLTLVSTNHASSNPGQVFKNQENWHTKKTHFANTLTLARPVLSLLAPIIGTGKKEWGGMDRSTVKGGGSIVFYTTSRPHFSSGIVERAKRERP